MLYNQTKLQIINAAMERMREPTVASSSANLYAVLVSRILDQVKTQMEAAWQWHALRDTYTVDTTAGITAYALTSAGQHAAIIDAWNTTTGRRLTRGTYASFNEKFFSNPNNIQTGDVTDYALAGFTSNLDPQIDVWPSPTRSNSLRVNVYVPQTLTDSTVVLIPNQVLIEGIVGYLMAERGDDNGTGVQAQMQTYQAMLGDAIARDSGHDESETAWEPV